MLPLQQRNAGVSVPCDGSQPSGTLLKPIPVSSASCPAQDSRVEGSVDVAPVTLEPLPRTTYDGNETTMQMPGPAAPNHLRRDLEFISSLQTHSDTFYMLGMCEGSRVARAMKAKAQEDSWRAVGEGRPARKLADTQKVVSNPLPRQPLARYWVPGVLTMDEWTPALDFGVVRCQPVQGNHNLNTDKVISSNRPICDDAPSDNARLLSES
ncbi:hypothetical protein BIW11_08031 [Tropilaelaps mercedesae]|uniref:Uncharacterized protein n=1 Tax=Tropilaelaps mercedesae TaxID=418985 RepID=A0A1V9XRH5_9ACAR|nr:hypothetical protein BIW11_08031 [Tropilaelaps mercedesae]